MAAIVRWMRLDYYRRVWRISWIGTIAWARSYLREEMMVLLAVGIFTALALGDGATWWDRIEAGAQGAFGAVAVGFALFLLLNLGRSPALLHDRQQMARKRLRRLYQLRGEAAKNRSEEQRQVVETLRSQLDDKAKMRQAREAVGQLQEKLAFYSRKAYNGSDVGSYQILMVQIEDIKKTVSWVAAECLDQSFESRFLAVNVLDSQADLATKSHFISRAQGSFWAMYQQIEGWRALLATISNELGRSR